MIWIIFIFAGDIRYVLKNKIMATLSQKMIGYIEKIYFSQKEQRFTTFSNDPILLLADYCIEAPLSVDNYFETGQLEAAMQRYKQEGIVGVVRAYFGDEILNTDINNILERKIIVMKTGLKMLPATKAATLFQGFGEELSYEQVLQVYNSYGLSRKQKNNYSHVDFFDINRRVQGLQSVMFSGKETIDALNNLYHSIRAYHYETETTKSIHIPKGMQKSLFYYYLNNVYHLGVLGLFPKYKSTIRQSKIGIRHEAWMVIDKIQHPKKTEIDYINYLKYNGIKVKRSVVNTIFRKWQVGSYKSAYISDLKRLQADFNIENENERDKPLSETPQIRYVDQNFISYLRGLQQNTLNIDSPGLFILWYYIEKLGIFTELERIGLTTYNSGHSWMDFFLFTIGRIFYGVDTYNAACNLEEPSIRFFASMIKTPCISTFLSRLAEIDEDKLFELQKWLVKRLQIMGLSSGKQIAFDFNQIDLDVKNKRLRDFGSGPSPKKKICYSGFRPHIAWDVDKGTLLVAEFRKSSARGTTTVGRFTNDFLMPVFKDFFEEVFIDSEYTGKNVWNFILDAKNGMGAEMVGCLKQNPLIKRELNKFILENSQTEGFWKYWDTTHVYSSKTFTLEWDIIDKENNTSIPLKLNCVVKKNIKNGKYRCFGSSHISLPEKILNAYSQRWGIENAIKDLIYSYYFNKCPGVESPTLVNTHFFIVTVCKTLYRMIQEDLGDLIKNRDGSIKTLKTMRNILFRQGSAKIKLQNQTFEIGLLNPLTQKTTDMLSHLIEKINLSEQNMKIIGGLNLKFKLHSPTEKVMKNSGTPQMLNPQNVSPSN